MIGDGQLTEFRCWAASMEARLPSVRRARHHNLRLLKGKTLPQILDLLLRSLPEEVEVVRWHVSGDFFSLRYWEAFLRLCRLRPGTLFYAYTKALRYWVADLERLPPNLVLTASYGGVDDELISRHGLRYARVVFSEQEAADLGLELDHDDDHARQHGPSFALLLHGSQPAGTPAAKALAALRANGEFGYGKRADEIRKSLNIVEVVR